MVLGANHPIGPLALADMVGLDTLLQVMDGLHIGTRVEGEIRGPGPACCEKKKLSPGAGDRDESEQFDWDMVELLRENGLYGTDFPETHGGSDAGMLALCLAIEELSKADASCGLLLADHELGSLPILLAGNESQRQKYLPQLASGERLAAFALTEPGAGSDVARLRCHAKKDGDSYVLNGTKNFITNGGVAQLISPVPARNRPLRGAQPPSWLKESAAFST